MADKPRGRPPLDAFLFQCFDCGAPAFLIRGSCEFCEPELHSEHRARRREIAEVDARYERETGRKPLDDWYAFEAWCDGR